MKLVKDSLARVIESGVYGDTLYPSFRIYLQLSFLHIYLPVFFLLGCHEASALAAFETENGNLYPIYRARIAHWCPVPIV